MKIKKVSEKVLDVHAKRKMKLHVKETQLNHITASVPNEKEGERQKESGKDYYKEKETSAKKEGTSKKQDRKGEPKRKKGSFKKKDVRKRMVDQFLSDKNLEEEPKDFTDTISELFRKRLSGMVQAAVRYVALALGCLLAVISIVAVAIFAVFTLLYHSPFAVVLPSISSAETTQDVLGEYLIAFELDVNEELDYLGESDESELIYVDFEGSGRPDTFKDILAVYMVKYGVGDLATDMTDRAKRNLKNVVEDMCCISIYYRTEKVPDKNGKLIEKEIKEVHVHYKTYENMILEYGFEERDEEMLLELMQMLGT